MAVQEFDVAEMLARCSENRTSVVSWAGSYWQSHQRLFFNIKEAVAYLEEDVHPAGTKMEIHVHLAGGREIIIANGQLEALRALIRDETSR